MSQKLKDLIPMLMCDDTRESIRFYTEVLGFTVTGRMNPANVSPPLQSVAPGRLSIGQK